MNEKYFKRTVPKKHGRVLFECHVNRVIYCWSDMNQNLNFPTAFSVDHIFLFFKILSLVPEMKCADGHITTDLFMVLFSAFLANNA